MKGKTARACGVMSLVIAMITAVLFLYSLLYGCVFPVECTVPVGDGGQANGLMKRSGVFSELNVKVGIWRYYGDNGKLIGFKTYDDKGRFDGPMVEYDGYGKLASYSLLRDGKYVSTAVYINDAGSVSCALICNESGGMIRRESYVVK